MSTRFPISPIETSAVAPGGWRAARLRDRLRAAGWHALFSLLLAGGVGAWAVTTWYPGAYFSITGGAKLLLMLVGVDVVLGPLLTLMVFDRRKRTLRLDLAIIAAVQAAGLAFGLHAAASGRPVYQVFSVDRFELVSAAELDPEELARAPASLRRLSWRGPRSIGARLPEDKDERETLMFASIAGGVDLRHMARYWIDYESVAREALSRARPIEALHAHNPPAEIERTIASTGRRADELRWLPLQARAGDRVMLLDHSSGTTIAVVALNPW